MEITDLIAILALVTSVVSITYTIVVDRRKPKLQVRGNIVHVFGRSPLAVQQHGPFFSISATNLGPGRVRVTGITLTHRSGLKRLYRRYIKNDTTQGTVLDTSDESPDKLPKWLEVGESLTLFYPADTDMLQENELFDSFHLYDSIGGTHWAPKRVFEKARQGQARLNEMNDMEDD